MARSKQAPGGTNRIRKPGKPGHLTEKGGMGGFALGALVLLVGLMCFALPTFIILFGGMAPTWVAFIVDDRRVPYRLATIAACNLAGVLPYLAILWAAGDSLDYAIQILSNVFAWATMFMGAVAGMAILWVGPHVAAMVHNMQAVKQRHSLDDMRRALIDEWGTDILPASERQSEKKMAPSSEGAIRSRGF